MLTDHERDRQLELVRRVAVESGRDPGDIEYTRWGSADLSPERIAELAAQGVDRIVVGFAETDAAQQHDRMSEFAQRFALTAD